MVLSVVNQKGGAGKTTTAVNTGGIAALSGQRVLLVDLDPQGSLTAALGNRFAERDLFTGGLVPVATRVTNLDLLPSAGMLLNDLEVDFRKPRRFGQLREVLAHYGEGYDLVVIDCPPDLNALTQNGIAAADMLLIPCRISLDVFQVDATLTTVEGVRNSGFPVTAQIHAVSTQLQRNAPERQAHAHFRRKYPFWLETTIRMSALYPRSVLNGKWKPAVAVCGRASAPVVDHTALARELGLIA